MEKINNSDLEHSAVYSGSNSAVNFPLWWNSSGSHVSQSSYSKNLNLNVNSPTQCPRQMKHVGWQLQDPDSNPTQSTDQPHQEVVGMRTEDGQAQFISAQSDGDRKNDSHMKSVLSLGTPDTTYSASKFDYGQSIGCIPFSYREPYFAGVMAAYGQNTIIHPQMISVTSSGRVPLPLELTEDGPIYVNAKQYHGILRRRQLRAKLEAQNKLVKGRKPYLHESRHRHAMKRIRGSGGRFLDTKQLQQQQQQQDQSKQSKSSTTFTDGKKSPASSLLELGGGGRFLGSDLLQSKNVNMSASGVSSGSEITDISNSDDMFQLSDHLRFAEFHPHVGGSMQGGVGMLYSGSQQRVPVIR